ncbi:nucleoside-diphosphate-sugar epimerase [Zeaxanthinibacter enoshimensis]|uniref:Nucleoside-diphosphate-sugar epimerase n=2 Tax=Zeaxanthinibacter enoshimensis TaxID=392009 RepID=A0A4R6TQ31_9FLAO|nr:nucleoside-diphosphate-sugar epimerase [Zeaxanthinibacter enoshimensis]
MGPINNYNMHKSILILGACGQIGTELTLALRERYGNQQVIASDIREGSAQLMASGPFEMLDATNYGALEDVVMHYEIEEVYLMAAMLSATAEKFPMRAWNLNMNSLFNVLNLAKDKKIGKVFWPSSIAVFGPNTPKENTPQHTIMEPSTVYGVSKQSGERWCDYYHKKFGVDVRSIRYPGLISWKTAPGGGTTDFAVDIYIQAIKEGKYSCFVSEETRLPMMYMDDAIRATLAIMDADAEQIRVRSSYNLAAMSFSPADMAASIREHIPGFSIDYEPDFRQAIADSWPSSIDDSEAQKDWGWSPEFDLEKTTREMLTNLK